MGTFTMSKSFLQHIPPKIPSGFYMCFRQRMAGVPWRPPGQAAWGFSLAEPTINIPLVLPCSETATLCVLCLSISLIAFVSRKTQALAVIIVKAKVDPMCKNNQRQVSHSCLGTDTIQGSHASCHIRMAWRRIRWIGDVEALFPFSKRRAGG